jgi:hypothetical protein
MIKTEKKYKSFYKKGIILVYTNFAKKFIKLRMLQCN